MLKKQQKMTKINQKNVILMSEKNLVTLINKGFSQKYVRIVNPLKQGLRLKSFYVAFSICYGDVRIVNPLKQGLRLLFSNLFWRQFFM